VETFGAKTDSSIANEVRRRRQNVDGFSNSEPIKKRKSALLDLFTICLNWMKIHKKSHTESLPKACQEKKLESTTLMVSADNDESLILGEKIIGLIGQIADAGSSMVWKLTHQDFEQMKL
jgi:hypothetical protein